MNKGTVATAAVDDIIIIITVYLYCVWMYTIQFDECAEVALLNVVLQPPMLLKHKGMMMVTDHFVYKSIRMKNMYMYGTSFVHAYAQHKYSKKIRQKNKMHFQVHIILFYIDAYVVVVVVVGKLAHYYVATLYLRSFEYVCVYRYVCIYGDGEEKGALSLPPIVYSAMSVTNVQWC